MHPKLPGSDLSFRVRWIPALPPSLSFLRRFPLLALALLLAMRLGGCAGGHRPTPPERPDAGPKIGFEQRGIASWYGPGFHGHATANGEIYDMEAMTAAHRTLAFGSVVEVRNLDNGRVTRVRINDRGPFIHGRIIDLSKAAARDLGVLVPGVANVRIRVVDWSRNGERTAARTASASPATAPRVEESTDSWWVQVGAFLEVSRADAQAARLRRYGTARVVEAGAWHRVLLGPYRGRRAADETAERLLADGYDVVLRPAEK